MKKYCIQIEGRHFITELDEAQDSYGFFVLRFVEGDDEDEACDAAIERIENSIENMIDVMNDPGDPPTINIVEVEQIITFDGVDNLQPDIAWYSESQATQG